MRISLNETGASTIKVWFWLIVLFGVIHVGYKLVPMYMDYTRMKDEMTVKAGVAQVLKDEEIRRDLESKAKELELPLTAESFVLRRDEERRRMKISAQWDVEVNFFGGVYKKTYHFEPVVEESIMNVLR